ncbi:MAG: M55 family metallopeptidase [Actinomycetota bacterium]
MRVAVCADMEGLTGIGRHEQCFPAWRDHYRHGVRMLVEDVRAAVEAALEAGASDALIADWHYLGRNIPSDAFPDLPIRRLWDTGRPLGGAAGLEGVDLAIFVGVHAGAGNPRGFLSHSFWAGMSLLLNDVPLSEGVFRGLAVGGGGVALGVLAGDQRAGEEAAGLLPGVRHVAVKAGVSRTSVILRAPDDAREELREAVRAAVSSPPPPLTHPFPTTATIRYGRSRWADQAEKAAVGDRTGPRDLSARLGSVHDLIPFLARGLLATSLGTGPALENRLLPRRQGGAARAWSACLRPVIAPIERRVVRSILVREPANKYPPVGVPHPPRG